MKTFYRKSLLSFFLFLLIFVTSCNSTKKSVSKSTDDHQIEVTFLQLNDVYEIAPLEGGKSGGMARVETVHKQLLKQNPNTLLFMAGDFLNPSLIGTMKLNGERIRGRQMVEVMNAMHFDLVAFGNHEFDLKYKDLQKRINESDFDWELGNALHKKDGQITTFYKEKNHIKTAIPKTRIISLKDADGTQIKIGFFSEVVDSNPKDYVVYQDPFVKAKEDYNALKDKVDIVIGLTHLTKESDLKILELLPKVPLIMGGHEHYNMLLTASTGGKVAKADANARTAYIHTLIYNTKTKKYNISSKLITIDDRIADDPQIKTLVDKWQQILMERVKTVSDNPDAIIFDAKTPLDAREKSIRHHQTNFGALVTDAMLAASKKDAEIALLNSGSIRIDDQISGDIVALDWFRAMPFGGSIYDVSIKGDLLKKVLDYGEAHKGKGSYLQRSKNIVQGDDGQWFINGEYLDERKTYRMITSDYLLKGYDIPMLKEGIAGIISVDKPKNTNLDDRKDIRKSVINYLKNKQ